MTHLPFDWASARCRVRRSGLLCAQRPEFEADHELEDRLAAEAEIADRFVFEGRNSESRDRDDLNTRRFPNQATVANAAFAIQYETPPRQN